MSNLSHIDSVGLDHDLAQWVEAHCTGTAKNSAERTHAFGFPQLMPATIILVHGVNSENGWYEDAASQFAEGLKPRLGREEANLPSPFIGLQRPPALGRAHDFGYSLLMQAGAVRPMRM